MINKKILCRVSVICAVLICFAMSAYAFADVDISFNSGISDWNHTSGSGEIFKEIYDGRACVYVNSPGELSLFEKKLDEKLTADGGIYELSYDLLIPSINTGSGKQTIMVEGHTAGNVNAFYGLRIDNGIVSYYNGTGQYNQSSAYKFGTSGEKLKLTENEWHNLKTVYDRSKGTFRYFIDSVPLFGSDGKILEVAAYEKVTSSDITKVIIRARNISDDKMYIDNISIGRIDYDYKDIYLHFENGLSDFALKSGSGTLKEYYSDDGNMSGMSFGYASDSTYYTHTLSSPVTSDGSVYSFSYDLYMGTPELESARQSITILGLAPNDVVSYYGLRFNDRTVMYNNGKGQYDISTAYKDGAPLTLAANTRHRIETVFDRALGVFTYYINGEPLCSPEGKPLRIKVRSSELDATTNRIAVIYKNVKNSNVAIDNVHLRKLDRSTGISGTDVYNITVRDEAGNELPFDGISGKTALGVSFDYSSGKNFTALAAMYKGNSLVSLVTERVDVSEGGVVSAHSFDVANTVGADSIKIFVWDDIRVLKPEGAVRKSDVPEYIYIPLDGTNLSDGNFTVWGDELSVTEKDGKTGVVLKQPVMSSDSEKNIEKKYSSDAGGPEKSYYMNFTVNNKTMQSRRDGEIYALEVEYYDKGYGAFTLEYDTEYESLVECEYVRLQGKNTWKKHTFVLKSPYFTGKDIDFRLATWGNMMRYSNFDVIFGSVKLSDISERDMLDITTKGSTIGNIYYTGEKPSFTTTVSGRSYNDYSKSFGTYSAKLKYSLTDENKNVLKVLGEKDITISHGTTLSDKISFNVDKYGLYYILAEVTNEDKDIFSAKYTEFSYVHSDKTTVNPDFGTSMQLPIYSTAGAEKLAINAGIGMLRWVRPMGDIMGVSYNSSGVTLTKKGWSSEWTKYENLTKDYTILNNLLTKNTAYSDETHNGYKLMIPYGDKGRELFAEYCRYFAENAPEGTKYYEIWNEFDSGLGSSFNTNYENWSNYGDLLVKAADAIYEVDPDAEIVALSARFVNTHKRTINRVKELIASGVAKHELKDYFKNTSIHPYHWNYNPMMFVSDEFMQNADTANISTLSEHMQLLRDVYDENGLEDTKIWISEIAWSPEYTSAYALAPVNEKQQGNYLVQSYVMAKQNNIVYKFLPYLFVRQTNVRVDRDKNMGIIKNQYSYNVDVPYAATSAYLAVSNMNMLLTGAEYADYFYFNRERTVAYRFTHRDGDDIAVLWSVYEDGEDVSINLGCSSVTVYDEYGNETVMTSNNGIYDFTLTSSTVYVKGNFTNFNKE